MMREVNNLLKTEISDYLKNKDLKIFFVGVGGISMSAIAAALISKNYKVGGSDIAEKPETLYLREIGAEIFVPHTAADIDGYGLIIYNARITEQNPVMKRARELNIPVIKRAQMLGALTGGYKKSIGVTGTHGKSTVTSMTSEIFMQAGTDPTFFIGAVYPPVNSAYQIGADDYFILEADEAYDSFLNLQPDIAVITNIEMDHPDYFKDLDAMLGSYKKYLAGTSELAVINADDANSLDASEDFGSRLTYALKSPADIRAENIKYINGFAEFDIYAHGEVYAHIKLSVPGDYNIYNALAASSAAYACNIPGEAISRALNIFKGASRRFELKGEFNDIKIYEDYAHHPTEIKKLLEAVRKTVPSKIWCVFQPHTYSRTSEFEAELCEVLSADYANIILTDILPVPPTEININNIRAEDIAKKAGCKFIPDFGGIAAYLKSNCSSGDIIILTGAGNINNITSLLI